MSTPGVTTARAVTWRGSPCEKTAEGKVERRARLRHHGPDGGPLCTAYRTIVLQAACALG
eukprot:1961846-Prymnesium_polylepis.1